MRKAPHKENLTVRVYPTTRKRAELAAALAQVTLSDFVRGAVEAAARRQLAAAAHGDAVDLDFPSAA